MAVTMTARWDDVGTVIPATLAKYAVNEQPIAEYDNWFNNNVVVDIQAVIDDVINKFNTHTILKADADNTPVALSVPTSTIVGRAAANIDALTPADVRTMLNVVDGADVTNATNVNAAGAVMDTDFGVGTMIKADSIGTPVSITIGYETILGNVSGDIAALTPAEARTLLNVENGADVTDSTNVNLAGAVMATDYNASTILVSYNDNDPVVLNIPVNSVVGRFGGGIDTLSMATNTLVGRGSGDAMALTPAEVRTLINVENAADVTDSVNVNSAGAVMETDYNANTILASHNDNDPVPITISSNAVVGRFGGSIEALPIATNTLIGRGSGDMVALSPSAARTILNVAEIGGNYEIEATPAADHTESGIIMDMQVGASSLTYGDACVVGLNGYVRLADADSASTMPAMLMAVENMDPYDIGTFMVMGAVRDDTWAWTASDAGMARLIYVSCAGTNGNTLTTTKPSGSGDHVQVVGYSISEDCMMFNPSPIIDVV